MNAMENMCSKRYLSSDAKDQQNVTLGKEQSKNSMTSLIKTQIKILLILLISSTLKEVCHVN